MTVHDGGFKHTAQKAEHISKGSVLALYFRLYSGGWSLKRLFFLCHYGSAALPWFLVSRTYLPMLCNNYPPHQVKRERHYYSSLPLLAEGEQWSGLMVTHVESSSWHSHNVTNIVRPKFVWYGSYLMVNRGRA